MHVKYINELRIAWATNPGRFQNLFVNDKYTTTPSQLLHKSHHISTTTFPTTCTHAPPHNHYCRYHIHNHFFTTTRITYTPLPSHHSCYYATIHSLPPPQHQYYPHTPPLHHYYYQITNHHTPLLSQPCTQHHHYNTTAHTTYPHTYHTYAITAPTCTITTTTHT